jgi:hypothetical protein
MPIIPTRRVFCDGDYTVASPSDAIETYNPFEFQPFTQVFSQKFQQDRDYFRPLPLGLSPIQSGMTPPVQFKGDPRNGTGPFLVKETPRRHIGGGIVEWTRIWAHVPAPIYEYHGNAFHDQASEPGAVDSYIARFPHVKPASDERKIL